MRDKTVKVGWGQIGVVTFRNLEFSLWEMGSCWRSLSQQCKAGGNPKAWHFMPGSHDLPSMREALRELELGPLHQCSSQSTTPGAQGSLRGSMRLKLAA